MHHRILRAALIVLLLFIPSGALAQNIKNPNDPLFKEQWALQTVNAPCAWTYTIGSPNVSVAIVDSGVDLKHPDLVGRIRGGYDFVDNDNLPNDQNGHGTNVAGIVAATLDNAEGIVGLAPGVSIMPVRVMNAEGFGPDRVIAEGVRYAADQGAKVINLSLGATLSIGAEEESSQVSQAISYAQSKGALVVVAAGNDFVPLPNAIIGSNREVLVVAATTENDSKAPFSNFGESVNIAAPGVHILSTMPTYPVFLTSDRMPEDQRFRQNYDYMSGTSQATPFVSALAALLFSAHPDWTAQQVAQAIKDNAVDISQQNRRLAEQGLLNAGRIDACASLSKTHATPSSPAAVVPSQPAPPPTQPGTRSGTFGGILLSGLICVAVLVFGFILFAVRRTTRRPRTVASPLYPLAPVHQQGSTQPAVVPPSSAWGTLVVIGGPTRTRSYPLAGTETLIGRAPECAVALLDDGTVSRRHALVRNNGQHVTVEDVGSSHGTFLNNHLVAAPIVVRRGDVLQVGQTLLRFE